MAGTSLEHRQLSKGSMSQEQELTGERGGVGLRQWRLGQVSHLVPGQDLWVYTVPLQFLHRSVWRQRYTMKQVTEDSALSRMPRTANASQWGHLLLLLHWALVITAAPRPAQKPSRREVGLAEREELLQCPQCPWLPRLARWRQRQLVDQLPSQLASH